MVSCQTGIDASFVRKAFTYPFTIHITFQSLMLITNQEKAHLLGLVLMVATLLLISSTTRARPAARPASGPAAASVATIPGARVGAGARLLVPGELDAHVCLRKKNSKIRSSAGLAKRITEDDVIIHYDV